MKKDSRPRLELNQGNEADPQVGYRAELHQYKETLQAKLARMREESRQVSVGLLERGIGQSHEGC